MFVYSIEKKLETFYLISKKNVTVVKQPEKTCRILFACNKLCTQALSWDCGYGSTGDTVRQYRIPIPELPYDWQLFCL